MTESREVSDGHQWNRSKPSWQHWIPALVTAIILVVSFLICGM